MNFSNTTFGLIVAIVLSLGVGFFGGLEYKEYQAKSVTSDTQKNVTSPSEDAEDSENKKANPNNKSADQQSSTTTDEGADEVDEEKRVALEILDKGFYSSTMEDQITFNMRFTNNTDKDIEGVEGRLVFFDMFGNQIYSSLIRYQEGISAGGSSRYDAGISYNQFIEEDQKLRNTSLEKIDYEWRIDEIVYSEEN